MFKRILKIILVLAVLIAIGLLVYWYFDRSQRTGDEPGKGGISIGDFFPFGGGNTETPETPSGTDTPGISTTTTPQIPTTPPRIWKISNEPQAGAVAFISSSTPFARYVDRATGNIFESQLTLLGTKRISNTTIPKIYIATWQPKGDTVIFQSLNSNFETIESILGKITLLPTASTSEETRGLSETKISFLPDDINSLSVNANGAFAYIIKTLSGSTVSVTNATGGSPRTIYSSPIRDLAVEWVNNTTLGLITKPSFDTPGYFYFLKTDSGRLDRVLGGMNGLTTLSNPDATKVVYAENENGDIRFGLFDIKTGEKTFSPLVTLPEKCVWSKKNPFLYCARPKEIASGLYPDHWYQGKVSFDDTFWKIDVSTGATELVIDPSTVNNTHVDAIDLALDPNENYLIFTNKKDSQLWGLRLTAIGS